MKTWLSEDCTKLVATYELHPFYFDHKGILTPWSLSPMINIPGAERTDLFNIPGLKETVTTFLRYQEFYLQPEFYTEVKANSLSVEVGAEVGHVGKTSYVFKGDVRLESSPDVILCRYNAQLVHVDLSTRQPTALPQKLRQKGNGPKPTFSLPTPPDTPMYSHSFKVEESDLDGNGHTGHAVYIRLCSDTAVFGMKTGKYPSLRGDLLEYPVRKIAMLYQKEAPMGDTVDVQTWEISPAPLSLGFQIKRGQDDIFRCVFELYGEKRAKL